MILKTSKIEILFQSEEIFIERERWEKGEGGRGRAEKDKHRQKSF